MITVSFYQLLSKGNGKDFGPVYMRVKGLDRRLNLSTGIVEFSKGWDKGKERFKLRHPNAYQLNQQLEAMEHTLLSYVENCLKGETLVTPEGIKNHFSGKEEKTYSLMDSFTSFMGQHISVLAKGTLKQYGSTKVKLIHFLKETHRTNVVSLISLEYRFISQFSIFLCDNYKNHPNTVNKDVTRLRTVINWTLKMGWLKQDPFRNFKSSTVPSVKSYLNVVEISKLESYKTNNPTIECVKDAFLFMCYTGLSYADLRKLKREDIQLSINGGKIIKLSRQKTMEYCMVPLIKKAEDLVAKYENHPFVLSNGLVMPLISNQKMNAHLNTIKRDLAINKKVTCHVARHSFATNALELGVPIETVSKALGHRSIKTTQIYARITESKLNRDFELLEGGYNSNIRTVAI